MKSLLEKLMVFKPSEHISSKVMNNSWLISMFWFLLFLAMKESKSVKDEDDELLIASIEPPSCEIVLQIHISYRLQVGVKVNHAPNIVVGLIDLTIWKYESINILKAHGNPSGRQKCKWVFECLYLIQGN